MGIGLLLLAAALFLIVYNFWSDAMAGVSSNTALEYLKPDNKEHTGVNLPVLPSGETLEEAYFPDYILNPEMDMPEKEVDGQKYIGVLRIPALSLELPVISEWSYSGLKESPCRYIGSAYLNNMVIVAHNYFSHFGHLKNLSQGDEITFTDVDGNIYYLYPVPDGTRGRMLTGWQTIDGKMYYFNTVSDGTRGALYVNRQTPDGYLVGADGARIAQ